MIEEINEYRIEFAFDKEKNGKRSCKTISSTNAQDAIQSVQQEFKEPITIRGVWILRKHWEFLGRFDKEAGR